MALKKEMLNIESLFLEDPETAEKLTVMSDLILEGKDGYSFIVGNSTHSVFWKHTIKTKEIRKEDYLNQIKV